MAIPTTTVALPAPFAWRGEHLAADLGHGATVLFTTRRAGPANVAETRARLEREVGRPIVQGRHVHGAVVERVEQVPSGEPAESDGQATARTDVAALVLTADCLPVALATPGAVAMLHAGWRGLAAGVLEEGIRAVRELGGGGPLTAAIGPAAGGCCYEVGDEVRAAFAQPPAGGPAPIDLERIARDRLEAHGARVLDVALCTMCGGPSGADAAGAPLFYSHRRDGGTTGRQAGVVWRSSSAA